MKRFLIVVLLCCVGTAYAQLFPELPFDKVFSKKEQAGIGAQKLSETEKENLRVLVIEKCLSAYDKGKNDGIAQSAKTAAPQQTAP